MPRGRRPLRRVREGRDRARPSTSASTRARSSRCSGRTAPARPRRSRRSRASCAPLGGEVGCSARATDARCTCARAQGLGVVSQERAVLMDLTDAREPARRRVRPRSRAGAVSRARAASRPPRRAAVGRPAADARARLAASRRRSRVLLVDELSLGLAPMVVDRLLRGRARGRRRGHGVLLVEQHIHKALAGRRPGLHHAPGRNRGRR